MTRIIEHRHAVSSTMLELCVFRAKSGEVRACIKADGLIMDQSMMDDISAPVAQAFLDTIVLCKSEDITTLWVNDPEQLFPPRKRPARGRI
jgi:hypothetical protein